MLNKFKLIPLVIATAFGLNACGDHDPRTAGADIEPRLLMNVDSTVYAQFRASSTDADTLLNTVAQLNNTTVFCDVKLYRIVFDTVDGQTKPTTSSGVVMLPHGTDPKCSGDRPLLLYGHGTSTDKNYDLSQLIADSGNPASEEAGVLLGVYASQGYAVIAPNYAGYADSTLDYHPYLDRKQQTTEMLDALGHVREYASQMGASFSDDLYVSGVSQGGYVAMATHKALEDAGEKVTASMPISGPYAMLDFMDAIFAGYVNGGATRFGPMAMTALDRAFDIYDDPSEVYASAYAGTAETALPVAGGFDNANLPPSALFSNTSQPPIPSDAPNTAGFGDNHLFADSLRTAYLADAQTNGANPVNKLRAAIKASDLRDWTPKSPILMCGASNDPVVYYTNTAKMMQHWSSLVGTGQVGNLDLMGTPAGPAAPVMAKFQSELQSGNISIQDLHSQTGQYCAFAASGYVSQVLPNLQNPQP